jgi:hypothetical protein
MIPPCNDADHHLAEDLGCSDEIVVLDVPWNGVTPPAEPARALSSGAGSHIKLQ